MAEERTFLAWLRSGLAALAVSLAVGRLLPVLLDARAGPYRILGLGFALLGLFLMIYGPIRHRDVRRALARGGFAPLPTGVVWVLAIAGVLLSFGTIAAILTRF
jgi:putative membrane protein